MNASKAGMRVIVLGWMLFLLPASRGFAAETTAADGFDWDIWRSIAVLDGGRTKPFDTLAWEKIYSFAGKSKWRPTAFATVGIADIADWPAFVAKLSSDDPAAKKLADRLPEGLLGRLKEVNFDTAPLEREVMVLDERLDKYLEDYVAEVGIALSMKEFREQTTFEDHRSAIQKFDEGMAKLDVVGQAKAELLQAINGLLPARDLVGAEALTEATGGKDPASLSPAEVAVVHRRQLEKTFAPALRPLTERELPGKSTRFEDRKYDPVELALTLALTWQGWDKTAEIEKLFATEDADQLGFNRVYQDFHQPDAWDVVPVVDARFQELAPKLVPETLTSASIRTVQDNPWFIRWALRSAKMREDKSKKADMTTLDEKGVDVLEAYRSFVLLRSGQTIFIGPDVQLKPRIDTINQQAAELDKKIGSLDHVKGAAELRKWKEGLDHESLGPAGKDLVEIADRLVKELDVQGTSAQPLPVRTLLEQQVRLRIEDIANQVHWLSLLDILALPDRVVAQGYSPEEASQLRDTLSSVRTSLLANDAAGFNASSRKFADQLSKLGSRSQVYPPPGTLTTELHYNRFQPFLWTAVLSGTALIIFALSIGLSSSIPYVAGLASLLAGIGFMIYGMYLRIMISGRPPVTNMYETIIWASFIMSLLAVGLLAAYRHRIIALTAALTLTPATLLAYVMPPEYGASIDPLVPVLRDNFWLIIHVLTIVASYGAFMLAWMLGNVGLAYYLTGHDRSKAIKPIALYIYRSIQVGVLLLAAGTILGGWWAAYSWGRFWGWDPKEVWALIALLGYLAVLHARFAGLLKVFGLIMSSVVAFAGVVMSWYGVNFVLGEGLHAYAFGSGGQPYVFTAVALNLAYVVIVGVVYRARGRSNGQGASLPAPRAMTPEGVAVET